MGALLERIAASSTPLVWLDDAAYSARLLAAPSTVWLDAAALTAFRRKAASLLPSDVTVVPIGAIMEAAVKADEELLAEMRAKKRVIAPLRTLLGDAKARSLAIDAAKALCGTLSSKPLVASIPSPRRWIKEAYAWAHGPSEADVDPEEVDSAAVYVAEFLRGLGTVGVNALLLEERIGDEPTSAGEIAWYQPVINVCKHYRWDIGLKLADGGEFHGEAVDMAFIIAPRPPMGTVPGVATPASFWADAMPPAVPAGGFRFAQIPADANPEYVLQRLNALRGD
ncbi:MAG: hypothetical protein ACLQO1_05555 [Steroidobacteraceae bacterium]